MPTTAGIVQVEAWSPQVSLDLSCMGKDLGHELSPAVWWDALAEAESVRLEPGVLRWDVCVCVYQAGAYSHSSVCTVYSSAD